MRITRYLVAALFALAVTSGVRAQTDSSQQTAPTLSPSVSTAAPATPVEDLTQTLQTPGNDPPQAPAAPAASARPAERPQRAGATPATVPRSGDSAAMQTAPELAEPQRLRSGFYLRYSGGIGLVSIAGDGPRGSTSITGLGSATMIAIGGTLARGVVLAGTMTTSSLTAKFKGGPYEDRSIPIGDRSVPASSKADASLLQLGLLLDWYPNPYGGWHTGVSAGLGLISVLNRADDEPKNALIGTTLAGSLFGGYDWSLGKDWSLGLSLLVSGTQSSTLKYADDGSDAGYRLRGGAVTLQTSLLYF